MMRGVGPGPCRFQGEMRKLMSYNAENFYRSRKGASIKSPEAVQALAQVILKENPDVIALQEVGDKAMLTEFNEKALGGHYPNVVSFSNPFSSRIEVAMMSKAGMNPLLTRSHRAEIQKKKDVHQKRDFLEVTFETDTGYRFTVFDAHYKSMGQDERKTSGARMKEVETATRILRQHFSQSPDSHVFVTGDFNVLHDSPFGKPVLELLTANKKLGRRHSFTEVMLKDGKADPTHNGRGHCPTNKLDYTFVSESLRPQIRQAYVAGNFQEEPWKTASDHLPLVTVFEEPDLMPKARRMATSPARLQTLSGQSSPLLPDSLDVSSLEVSDAGEDEGILPQRKFSIADFLGKDVEGLKGWPNNVDMDDLSAITDDSARTLKKRASIQFAGRPANAVVRRLDCSA